MLSQGANETIKYLGGEGFDSSSVPELYGCCRGNLSVRSAGDRLVWGRGVLGELDPDKARAVLKGVRYTPWQEVKGRWMASSTVGVPHREGAKWAYVVAEEIMRAKELNAFGAIDDLSFGVVERVFGDLCRFYGLNDGEVEAMFDDNATMVLYQFLGLLGLKGDDHVMTFYDTGRVMPEALKGQNPEKMAFNFKPNIDLWNNAALAQDVNLPFKTLHLVEHYRDNIYRSDEEILTEILSLIASSRPKVIIIPTITRVGRRLDFVDIAQKVRTKAIEVGYDPLIFLDDAQGLARQKASRYYHNHVERSDVSSIWDYADGILLTGAKVVGALMGTGVLLLNRKRIEGRLMKFDQSPLAYRARKLGYFSEDLSRMSAYNRAASGVVQVPELASFIPALADVGIDDDLAGKLINLRVKIVEELGRIGGLNVLQAANGHVRFVNSIVAFMLEDLRGGRGLKDRLAALDAPITLPAIVDADGRDYMRIAIDPRRLKLEGSNYVEIVMGVVEAIADVLK